MTSTTLESHCIPSSKVPWCWPAGSLHRR